MTNSEKIAQLNDAHRQKLWMPPNGGRTILTEGIMALDVEDRGEIMSKVVQFNDFTEGDDPYGERDFGAFDYDGQKIFWKIDYYDRQLDGGSEDPANPAVTTRVLTILLASEY
jgi:hypothetical protein